MNVSESTPEDEAIGDLVIMADGDRATDDTAMLAWLLTDGILADLIDAGWDGCD